MSSSLAFAGVGGGPRRPPPLVHLRPRDVLWTLLSFESVFVLFLFAGRYKADPRFAWIPVDLTGALFALTVLTAVFIVVRGRVNLRAWPLLLAGSCLVAWTASSMMWSPSSQYALQKTFLFGTVTLGSMVASGLIIAADPARVRRFLTMVLLFGIWFGIEALIVHLQAERRTFVIPFGVDYHGFSRVCSLAALVALVGWLFTRGRPVQKVVLAVVLVMLGYVLLVSGARSPLLALIVAGGIPLLVGFRTAGGGIRLQRFQISLLVAYVAAAAVLVYLLVSGSDMTMTLQRLMIMTGGIEEETSARIRLGHYTFAMEAWGDAPIVGHGVGAWPILNNVGDIRRHPHNIFLEIGVELGVIGLLIFGVVLFLAVRRVRLASLNDPLYLCVFLLFVNTFLSAQLNDDLSENRDLFAMLGLLAMPLARPTTGHSRQRDADPSRLIVSARPVLATPLQDGR